MLYMGYFSIVNDHNIKKRFEIFISFGKSTSHGIYEKQCSALAESGLGRL